MVDVDASVIVQLINFLFLIFALNLVLYKPIRKILLQRKEKLDGLEAGIDALTGDAKEKDDAFAQGLKAARAKGLKEKEGLLSAAAEEERKIVDAIAEKAHAELAEVRRRCPKRGRSGPKSPARPGG